MPLNFPGSPSLGQQSVQNGRTFSWTGYAWELVAASGGSGEDALLRSLFVPSAPTALAATAGNASVSLGWTAPTGVIAQAPITGYRVEYTPSGGSPQTVSTGSTATSYTLSSLTNGTAYTARVAAVNAVGLGAYTAASSSVTPVAGDALFANVALLLPMDGTGASFVDASAVPKAITAVGNATQSTAQSKWGGKSAYFDGSGDYLSVIGDVASFGTSDFAVEFWLYYTGTGTQYSIFDTRSSSSGLAIYKATDDTLRVYTSSDIISGGAISANTWHHIALARSGSDIRLFLNGTQTGSTFSTLQNYSDQLLTVGADFPRNGRWTQGYIDDLRITKGHARYTANFTPPTAAFPTDGPMSAPTSLAATGGNAQVSLTWTAPSYNGGSAITDYTVQYSSNSGSTWTTFSRSASTTASATVTGLTNGTAYTFQVRAINAVGNGNYSSASSAVTPAPAAAAPITAAGWTGNGISTSKLAPPGNFDTASLAVSRAGVMTITAGVIDYNNDTNYGSVAINGLVRRTAGSTRTLTLAVNAGNTITLGTNDAGLVDWTAATRVWVNDEPGANTLTVPTLGFSPVPFTLSGAGTLASPYFFANRDNETYCPVFWVKGTRQITFVFGNHNVYDGDGNAPVVETVYSFNYFPDLNVGDARSPAALGATLLASGRNTTVTHTVTDKFLVMRSNNAVWGPYDDSGGSNKNPFGGKPSIRVYAS